MDWSARRKPLILNTHSLSPLLLNQLEQKSILDYDPNNSFFYNGLQLDIDFRIMFPNGTFGGTYFQDLASNGKTKDVMKKLKKRLKNLKIITALDKKGIFIHPNNHYKLLWDFLISLLSVISAIFATYELAFEIGDSIIQYKLSVNKYFALDIFFIADIIVHCYTGYFDEGYLIKRKRAIIIHYIKTTFVFHLITALPLYYWNIHDLIFKMPRIIYIGTIFELIQYYVANLTNTLWVAMVGLLTMYIVGCIIRYIAGINDEYFSKFQLKNSQINVIFFVIQTMTTVGYGNIVPQANVEIILTMFLEVVSVLYYGYCLSDIKAFMTTYEGLIEVHSKESDLNIYLLSVERNLPTSDALPMNLSLDIKNEIMSNIASDIDNLIKDSEFFQKLPPKQKKTLLQFLFKPMADRYKSLFTHMPDDMKYLIFKNLSNKMYMPNSDILIEGQYSNGLYFITKGIVSIISDKQKFQLLKINNTTMFGELFIVNQSLSYTYRSIQIVQVRFISAETFMKICNIFPRFKKKLIKFCQAREDFLKQLEEKQSIKFRQSQNPTNEKFSSLKTMELAKDITQYQESIILTTEEQNGKLQFDIKPIDPFVVNFELLDNKTSNEDEDIYVYTQGDEIDDDYEYEYKFEDDDKDSEEVKHDDPLINQNQITKEQVSIGNTKSDKEKSVSDPQKLESSTMEFVNEYDPELDPLFIGKNSQDSVILSVDILLNSSIDVPINYLNIKIPDKVDGLGDLNLIENEIQDSDKLLKELASVVHDLKMKVEIIETRFEKFKDFASETVEEIIEINE